ncbi:MAG: hypothetical protein OQK12_04515 [Motiliproteus sp.]|nr:hypothetical protein [Motiliproteus sp.]MCW9051471.1 hypothetical protein [Motiliproteus sp.]
MKAMRRRTLPKPPPARETHDSIRQQTEDYLRHGGSITIVPQGQTGVPKIAGPCQQIRKLRH